MARNIRSKSPAKRPKKQERFILVDLDDDLDPNELMAKRTFKTQQEAEAFAIEYEPESQIAVAKIISISDEPEPQPRIRFNPV